MRESRLSGSVRAKAKWLSYSTYQPEPLLWSDGVISNRDHWPKPTAVSFIWTK